MKYEMRRVDPLRAANLGGVVYGIVMAIFALLFLPFMLLFAVIGHLSEGAGPALWMPLLLVIYPIIGAIMGWVSGLITAAIYNLAVGWIGGLRVELVEEPAGPA